MLYSFNIICSKTYHAALDLPQMDFTGKEKFCHLINSKSPFMECFPDVFIQRLA